MSYDNGRWDESHAAPQTAYLIVSVYLFGWEVSHSSLRSNISTIPLFSYIYVFMYVNVNLTV